MEPLAKKILNRLAAQCSKREYCSHDIDQKLSKYPDLTTTDKQQIKQFLLKERYVDDSRYANFYVRDKARFNGWGITKIRFMLKSKHIDDDTINQALQQLDNQLLTDKLSDLLTRKNKQIKDENPTTRRQKLLRYGLSRGYNYDEVLKLITSICNA